jgi:hypothetical protein
MSDPSSPEPSNPSGTGRVRRFRPAGTVDSDASGEELILMHLETLELRVLNAAGAVLWEALEEFDTAEALAGLLVEADPATPPEEHRARVDEFLADLIQAGFVVEVP